MNIHLKRPEIQFTMVGDQHYCLDFYRAIVEGDYVYHPRVNSWFIVQFIHEDGFVELDFESSCYLNELVRLHPVFEDN